MQAARGVLFGLGGCDRQLGRLAKRYGDAISREKQCVLLDLLGMSTACLTAPEQIVSEGPPGAEGGAANTHIHNIDKMFVWA